MFPKLRQIESCLSFRISPDASLGEKNIFAFFFTTTSFHGCNSTRKRLWGTDVRNTWVRSLQRNVPSAYEMCSCFLFFRLAELHVLEIRCTGISRPAWKIRFIGSKRILDHSIYNSGSKVLKGLDVFAIAYAWSKNISQFTRNLALYFSLS